MPDTAPLVKTVESNVPAQGTAATDQKTTIGEAPFAGTVTAAKFVPTAAITADNTNNRTFTVTNKGQDGSGTTAVASYQSNTAGGSAAAEDEKALTLSGTPANLTVAQGDVLELTETHAGTGVAHGGGRIIVEVTRS